MTSLATPNEGPDEAPASEEELLDILYEIMTDDRADEHGVQLETIEAFVHAHARGTQAGAGVVRFFREHGLSMRPEDYGLSRQLAATVSGTHPAPIQEPTVEAVPSAQEAAMEPPDSLSTSGLTENSAPAGQAATSRLAASGRASNMLNVSVGLGRNPLPLDAQTAAQRNVHPPARAALPRWVVASLVILAVALTVALGALASQLARGRVLEKTLDQERRQVEGTSAQSGRISPE